MFTYMHRLVFNMMTIYILIYTVIIYTRVYRIGFSEGPETEKLNRFSASELKADVIKWFVVYCFLPSGSKLVPLENAVAIGAIRYVQWYMSSSVCCVVYAYIYVYCRYVYTVMYV